MNIPNPSTETARQQALEQYSILDTLAEQAYDDITKLASYICDTPFALISLVDHERLWFKSRFGLEVDGLPREDAFCDYAILHPDEVMLIQDTTRDPRFMHTSLVVDAPKIRFYAGAPLVTPGGEAIGTVCVIDQTPRTLSAEQIDSLRALSRQVIAQLELRRNIAQLEIYQQELEKINDHLRLQITVDGLTGLKNRQSFQQNLEEEWERFTRYNTPFSLLMIDVDKFKAYNDDFGHLPGDELLRQLALLLHDEARTNDFVARYGGEEFAMILPSTDLEGAVIIAERLCKNVRNISWPRRAITISIGVATAEPGLDVYRLIERADKALYFSKSQGRDQVSHFHMVGQAAAT